MSLANMMIFLQVLVNYGPSKLLRVKGLRAVAGSLATPAVITLHPRQGLPLAVTR